MSDPADFRPTGPVSFDSGALGETVDRDRATATRRYRLSSGTPVIHAAPEDATPRARIVMLPSLRGHTPMFAELCARLAALYGYEIISPELFQDPRLTEPERIALCRTKDHAKVIEDARLAAMNLRPGPVVVMGFCLGGMFACLATAAVPIAGAISFYGFIRMPSDWEQDRREEPLDAVRRASVPVLGVFGGNDRLIPRADVTAMEATQAQVVVFEEAGHAFAHDPSLPSYRLEDARRAWRSAIEFIETVGTSHD